jgi:uncharacterized UBP type Zn finger protein
MMEDPPKILVVQLNRFNDHCSKINEKCNNIKDIIILTGSFCKKEPKYKLKAFIIHIGKSLSGGHYVTVKKETEADIWYYCNDNSIQNNINKVSREHSVSFFFISCNYCINHQIIYFFFF